MIGDKFTLIIAIVIGIAVGFGIGYLSKALADRILIAELEQQRDRALLQKQTMQDQWEQAVNELNGAKVLLNDTLAALELLREYQSIDDETRNKINKIDNTLDPEGNPTEETYDEFRKLVEEMNKLNQEFNTGSLAMTDQINLRPFVELREDAEQLFDKATELLLQYRER